MKTAVRVIGLVFVVLIFSNLNGVAFGDTFCVDTSGELQNALTTSASNGQDDVIWIVQGTYNGNFVYTSTESYSLSVEGGYVSGCASRVVDPQNTVLDGGASGSVMVISTQSTVLANFTINGVNLKNGYIVPHGGGGLYILSSDGNIILT